MRGPVARQHVSNPTGRARFARVLPLVQVTIASEDMPVRQTSWPSKNYSVWF